MILSCAQPSAKTKPAIKTDRDSLRTGFYFLSSSLTGANKKKEQSENIYRLETTPFASVENIISTKLERTKTDHGTYTELCMTFDSTVRSKLADGTGNSLHPQIAVIINNKLLYVVDNNAKIITGVMCVGLVGYSEKEMQGMKEAVDEKK
jgi:hypothetical protein